MRVLICEDEGLTVLKLRRLLAAAGHTVVGEAKSGEECLAVFDEAEPDLVLMDIKMPGMDGTEATRQLMDKRPLPVVMLTAYSDDETVRAATEAGACAYLVKPVSRSQLLSALHVAAARFAELEQVKREVQDLNEALEIRKLVERAKGLLMDRAGLSEGEAFRRLQKASRDQRRPMKLIALEVIEAGKLMAPQMVPPRRTRSEGPIEL
jgi:AmiR/NasT family two-component response regulator